MMHVPRAMRSALEKAMYQGTYKFQSDFARKYIALGEAQAILQVLEARGLSPSERARKRISSCRNEQHLVWWLRRAATAEQVSDVFTPLKARKARARVRKAAK